MPWRKTMLSRIMKGEVTQGTLDEWMGKLKEAEKKAEESQAQYAKLREAVQVAHEKGMSVREIAQFVGVTHATIWNWLTERKHEPLRAYERLQNAKKSEALPTQQ